MTDEPAGDRAHDPGDPNDADEVVYQSALQLWAAAQTDFDPYEAPPSQWRDPVPVRDVDVAVDTGVDLGVVRASLRRLDGVRLHVGDAAGELSVQSVISEGGVP